MDAAYYVLALIIVVGGAAALVVGAILAVRWAVDVVRRVPAVGAAGVVVTAVAAVNLLVARTCATTDLADGSRLATVNRPVLALFVERGDCFRTALGQVAIVALLGVATSVAVRLVELGRHRSLVTIR